MDTNYNDEMEYANKIAKTLNSLEKQVEVVNTPAVLPSEKLKNAGNNLYIDENGVLRVQPVGFAKTLNKHFGQFAQTTQTESVADVLVSSSLVQEA